MERRLFILQRATALLLAPLVLGHVATMIYAIDGGLSGAEILARTRGNVFWGAYYSLFIAAIAIHAPIGLRAVLREWTNWRGRGLDGAMVALGLLLAGLGAQAVAAVVLT
jgi:fumarate reductase subunit C